MRWRLVASHKSNSRRFCRPVQITYVITAFNLIQSSVVWRNFYEFFEGLKSILGMMYWSEAYHSQILKDTASIFNHASTENKNAVRYGHGQISPCRAESLNISWQVLWPASVEALSQELFSVQTCSPVMLGARVMYDSNCGIRKEMYVIGERIDGHFLLSHSV